MPNGTLTSQSLEIVSLWEDAVCLHAVQKSLVPANLIRAKKRLAKLSAQGSARHFTDQPFFFYRVCVVIARQNGSATMGELSGALGIPLSTATRFVNRLAAGGYVERLADLSDRRIVRIALTTEGHTLYRTIHDFAQQRVETALRHFTPRERKVLLVLLNKALP
ncbi:MAG: MarR family winged helix-turn-helix transcriptional regulator, partial [Anaerolineales bacterium]|nr:MarR family winged helix-turn-helix transcriptional regulator [Anaerolineales bacterium]